MNSKSPTKIRRALSSKNINYRSSSFSPKKAELLPRTQSRRSSPTRTSPKRNSSDQLSKTDSFQFFEESTESQELTTLKQKTLRKSQENTPTLVADRENDAKTPKLEELHFQASPARRPMADLNVDDHAGTWEIYTTESSGSRSASQSPPKSLSSKSLTDIF
ncbi:LAFA_0B08042g1_1 [Lachancea sp. 'fantastica']|nr:LAFA_0B08042g1_1 [Lachancea sp. 'fantastica']